MTKYERLDRIAQQYPLGTCIKSSHPDDPIFGRVIGWTIFHDGVVSVDAMCIPGHYPMHLMPDCIKAISPSQMPDYTKMQF